MDPPFDLGDIVRRWQFGRLYGEDLPEIAVRALEAGFDSPALRELAWLDRPTMRDAGPIFRRALDELGQDSSTIAERPLYFAAGLARRILAREVGLGDGCQQMVAIRSRGHLRDCEALEAFFVVWCEAESIPEGNARDRRSADVPVEADREAEEFEALYGGVIDDACRALLATAPALAARLL